jgi:hypothetical protein
MHARACPACAWTGLQDRSNHYAAAAAAAAVGYWALSAAGDQPLTAVPD